MERVLVSIPDGAWEMIEKELKGKIGERDSEIGIFIIYQRGRKRVNENGKRKGS